MYRKFRKPFWEVLWIIIIIIIIIIITIIIRASGIYCKNGILILFRRPPKGSGHFSISM